jgi:hypothetical protein
LYNCSQLEDLKSVSTQCRMNGQGSKHRLLLRLSPEQERLCQPRGQAKSFETDLEKGFLLLNVEARLGFNASRAPMPVVKRRQYSANSKRSVILAMGLDRIGLRGLGCCLYFHRLDTCRAYCHDAKPLSRNHTGSWGCLPLPGLPQSSLRNDIGRAYERL